MNDHYDRYNGMDELLSTDVPDINVGELISRAAAIDRATKEHDFFRGAVTVSDKARRDELLNVMCWLGELPPIQPDNGLQSLADEIASFKRCVKSENSDYLTGYLCALSVVEGMIADMRGKQNG